MYIKMTRLALGAKCGAWGARGSVDSARRLCITAGKSAEPVKRLRTIWRREYSLIRESSIDEHKFVAGEQDVHQAGESGSRLAIGGEIRFLKREGGVGEIFRA